MKQKKGTKDEGERGVAAKRPSGQKRKSPTCSSVHRCVTYILGGRLFSPVQTLFPDVKPCNHSSVPSKQDIPTKSIARLVKTASPSSLAGSPPPTIVRQTANREPTATIARFPVRILCHYHRPKILLFHPRRDARLKILYILPPAVPTITDTATPSFRVSSNSERSLGLATFTVHG